MTDSDDGQHSNRPALHPDIVEFEELVRSHELDSEALFEPDAIERLAQLHLHEHPRFLRFERAIGGLPKGLLSMIRDTAGHLRRDEKDARSRHKTRDTDERKSQFILPRFIIGDITIEKAAVMSQQQPRGLLQARDELSGLIENMGRYSNGSDRQFYLESYGGRPHTQDRMGRPEVYVANLTIGMLGGIQPDKLGNLLLQSADDGFLARQCPIWPEPVERGRPRTAPSPVYLERIFERLHSLHMPPEGPLKIPVEDAALDRLVELQKWQREIEDTDGLLQSYAGKLPGFALRLALTLAFLEWAESDYPDPPECVATRHLESAIAFVRLYAYPMAERAYAEASVPPEVRGAKIIADIIVSEKITLLSQREVQRRALRGLRRAKQIEASIDVLIQAAWLRPTGRSSGPVGGRPRLEYPVNPKIHQLRH